ncbi:hypothetical protein [Patulibacter sp. SYSU D01012]|uniref:hypothetical protein n=1 Tax=Patulibacter sp. SYSU D01012 TaxID=2817381 RepID=UPI001B306161|nr:hypothetical protein [Patulibacter sp. SYSU D01012]
MNGLDPLPLVAGHLHVLGAPEAWGASPCHTSAALCILDAVLSPACPRATVERALEGYRRLRRAQGQDPTPDTPLDLAVTVHALGGPERFASLLTGHGGAPAPTDVERAAAVYGVAKALAEEGVARPGRLAAAGRGVHEHLRLRWLEAGGAHGAASWELFLLLCGVTDGAPEEALRAFVAEALGHDGPDQVAAPAARGMVDAVARAEGVSPLVLRHAIWRRQHHPPEEPPPAPLWPPAAEDETASGDAWWGPVAPGPHRSAETSGHEAADPAGPARTDGGTAVAGDARGATVGTGWTERPARAVPPVSAVPPVPPGARSLVPDGAAGKRAAVAQALLRGCDPTVVRIGDRRVGEDVAHVAVAPSGVWVIACHRERGRVAVEDAGSSGARLRIGGQDRSGVVADLTRAVGTVGQAVLAEAPGVAVHGALCLLDADLPLFGTLHFGGCPVLRPRALPRRLNERGPLDDGRARRLAAALADRFPAA